MFLCYIIEKFSKMSTTSLKMMDNNSKNEVNERINILNTGGPHYSWTFYLRFHLFEAQ